MFVKNLPPPSDRCSPLRLVPPHKLARASCTYNCNATKTFQTHLEILMLNFSFQIPRLTSEALYAILRF